MKVDPFPILGEDQPGSLEIQIVQQSMIVGKRSQIWGGWRNVRNMLQDTWDKSVHTSSQQKCDVARRHVNQSRLPNMTFPAMEGFTNWKSAEGL